MGRFFKTGNVPPTYAVLLYSPNEPVPAITNALQYKDGNLWRTPRNRKEALWCVEHNLGLVDPTGWSAELIEFKPGKRWGFRPKSVAEAYPHLEWSEADGKYIDPTKIDPEAAGFTQEEADAGFKHEASDESASV